MAHRHELHELQVGSDSCMCKCRRARSASRRSLVFLTNGVDDARMWGLSRARPPPRSRYLILGYRVILGAVFRALHPVPAARSALARLVIGVIVISLTPLSGSRPGSVMTRSLHAMSCHACHAKPRNLALRNRQISSLPCSWAVFYKVCPALCLRAFSGFLLSTSESAHHRLTALPHRPTPYHRH